jgi:hypothetical protein
LSSPMYRCPKFGKQMDRSVRVRLFASLARALRGLSNHPHGPFRTTENHLNLPAVDALATKARIKMLWWPHAMVELKTESKHGAKLAIFIVLLF